MKWRMKAVIGCVVTAGLTVVLLVHSSCLMERKASITRFASFFEQEEDFDVLFMGTSHMMDGVFPMELWNDYGIVSYNFGGYGNPLATSYWIMENALDYTAPKLMVIDCFYLSSDPKTNSNFSFLHTSFDAFPLSRTKIHAIKDLLDDENAPTENDGEARSRMGFLWNYSVYHTRWGELGSDDFSIMPETGKGAEAMAGIAEVDEMIKIPAQSKWEKDTVSIGYLEKMIEDCQNRGIDVLLTYIPFPAGENQQKEANRAYDIAKKYGVEYINFLDLDIVNYDTDLYDDTHLNPSGARKITDYLGQYIMEHYDIPDQRTNESYSGWYKDYEAYEDYKLTSLRSYESLDIYLMYLADKNYSLVIEINNAEIWNNESYMCLMENLGVDKGGITENTDFLVIQEAGKHVDYLEDFHGFQNRRMTALGEFSLFTAESGTYGVYLDDEEFYTVSPKQNQDIDIRIAVIDVETAEILDLSSFYSIDQEQTFKKNGQLLEE